MLLILRLFILGGVGAIKCPIYNHGWETLECPNSPYCQFNYMRVVNPGNGNSMIEDDVFCGAPGSKVTTAEPEVLASRASKKRVPNEVFAVGSRPFCQVAPDRWCRITPGPDTCHRLNCALLECRCTSDHCHALKINVEESHETGLDVTHPGSQPAPVEDLIARLGAPDNFGEEWRARVQGGGGQAGPGHNGHQLTQS